MDLQSSIPLEAINGVNDLVENLEKIDVSPQIVSAIDDPLLQRYLELGSNNEHKARTQEWLTSFLDEQLQKAEQNQVAGKALTDGLQKLLNYTQYIKVSRYEW